MYISDTNYSPNPKPQPRPRPRPRPRPASSIDFSDDDARHDMMIEVVPTSSIHGPTRILGSKKRAETWVQEETRSLINLRREMDPLFNTSKSNKHLWEQISSRMRDRGFDRSPTMCTDKWRNLLKEFKKAKQQANDNAGNGGPGNGSAKMSYYKDIEEILRERSRCSAAPVAVLVPYRSPNHSDNNHDGNHSAKVDLFLQFSDKGINDASIPFGPIEANERPTLNLERRLDHGGHPLAITAADTVTGSGVPPFWRDPGNGDESQCYGRRVITVKWGDYTRRVGVDGTSDAIKDVIRSLFGIRSRRAFWLEDEEQVVCSLDRDLPPATYTLHLDQGTTIKLCHYEESDQISYPSQTISHTEEWTFYSHEEFCDFLHHRGWSCLRELNGYRNIANVDELRPDVLYRGLTS